jgi:hypothetical protein
VRQDLLGPTSRDTVRDVKVPSSLPPEAEVLALLEAARKAIPHSLDPHPCTVRCPRVGVPCDVYPDGKCMECSGDARRSDPRPMLAKLKMRPELLVSLCEGFLILRRTMDNPAVLSAAYAAAAGLARGERS